MRRALRKLHDDAASRVDPTTPRSFLLQVDGPQAVDFASPRCRRRHDGRMLAVIFEAALRSVSGPRQRPGMAVR
jgi:hypothetical protein